jgi:hypothetical protein
MHFLAPTPPAQKWRLLNQAPISDPKSCNKYTFFPNSKTYISVRNVSLDNFAIADKVRDVVRSVKQWVQKAYSIHDNLIRSILLQSLCRCCHYIRQFTCTSISCLTYLTWQVCESFLSELAWRDLPKILQRYGSRLDEHTVFLERKPNTIDWNSSDLRLTSVSRKLTSFSRSFNFFKSIWFSFNRESYFPPSWPNSEFNSVVS